MPGKLRFRFPQPEASGSRRASHALPILLVLPALGLMVSGVTAPLGGSHTFRQAHVAANIDKLVQNRISLHPATYNDDTPFSAFDFPLYQVVVAEVCRVLSSDPLETARVVSILLFAATLAVLHRLVRQAGLRRWTAAAAIALYSWAPLDLFYFQAPMVDDLALMLAAASLQQYVAAQRGDTRGPACWLMLLCAFLSTLIKSPVYLPVLLAILWQRLRTAGARALLRADILALLGTTAAAVLSFKAYWMMVNGVPDLLSSWERQTYFGTLAERIQPWAWGRILSDLVCFTSSPGAAALAAGGLAYWARRAKGHLAPLFTGLLLGCGITLVVFFDRYPPHNYYQLPIAFPLAFFAAQGLEACRVLRRAVRRYGRPRLRLIPLIAPLALGTAALWGVTAFRDMATNRAASLIRSHGEWIRDHTAPGDYVVYIVEGPSDNWNPAYLYFAKRDGCNLPPAEATPARLEAVAARAHGRSGRVLVYGTREEGERLLADLGGVLAAEEGRRHVLFRLPAFEPDGRFAPGARGWPAAGATRR